MSSISADDNLDITLRPKEWDDYIGQERIKNNLEITIRAAKERGDSPEHILFYGNPGLGKTSLAYLVAKEINGKIRTTSGPSIERTGDLIAILTSLEKGDVFFIDEIHRLPKIVEEQLYSAMEDFKLNIVLGRGAMAKTAEISLEKFTLIGATTKLASVSTPLRSRFGLVFGLNFYSENDIEKILAKSAKILGIETTKEALKIIAKSSRLTPRTANHLLKRVRDFSQLKKEVEITEKTAKEALRSLEIDEIGLTPADRKILRVIIEKFNGGPVGLQALAAASYEEEYTILNVYEPYLIRIGFIERTPKGRIATSVAYRHLFKFGEQKKLNGFN